MTTTPHVPLDARRLGPLLASAGFTTRELPGGLGFGDVPPMIVHHHADAHLVALIEYTEPRRGGETLITELAVFPEPDSLPLAEADPVTRLHHAAFRVAFAANVPAPVVQAASIAACTVTVPRRATR